MVVNLCRRAQPNGDAVPWTGGTGLYKQCSSMVFLEFLLYFLSMIDCNLKAEVNHSPLAFGKCFMTTERK